MYRITHGFFIGLFVLLTGLSPIYAADPIAKGDFDKDGDVDFADFLVFADNFNKPLHEQTWHVTDTIVVRDTIVVTNTFESAAGVRAGRMLGFWYLNVEYEWEIPSRKEISEYDLVFQFTHIDPMPNEDGEYNVHGVYFSSSSMESAYIVKGIVVSYSKSEQAYILRTGKIFTFIYSKEFFHLEIKFHFENEIRQDMTERLNVYFDGYEKIFVEPVVKIDHIHVIREYEVRPTSSSNKTETRYKIMNYPLMPINDGLRRANREEFMTKFKRPRVRVVR